MRMFAWAGLVAVVGGLTGRADERPDPIVTARIRPVIDLVNDFEYLGGLVGQGEPAKQAAQLIRGLADPDKGIEGIDPNRPIGLYGVLSPDVVNSYAVVVVPVADENAVKELLTGRLNLTLKSKDDIYELSLPNIPAPIFFRFANKSVYVTARFPEPLADDKLMPPTELFAGEEEAVAVVNLYPGRVPGPLRRIALGQLELQLKQQARDKPASRTADAEYWRQAGREAAFEIVKSFVLDATELSARFGIDTTTDDLTGEVTVTPKTGSALAKWASTESGLNGAAGRLARPGAVAAGGVRIDIPKSMQKDLDAIVDKFVVDAGDRQVGEDKKIARAVVGAIAPTLKSRVVDFGLLVVGDTPGQLRAVAEFRVAEGAGIVRMLKDADEENPSVNAKTDFDVTTVGNLSLHKVTYIKTDELVKATGSPEVWLATADDRLLISVGPDNDLLKKAIQAQPKIAPFVQLDVSASQLFKLSNSTLPADTVDKLVATHVGTSTTGKDSVRLTVTGGKGLTARLTVKGKAVRLAAAIDQTSEER